MTAVELKLSNLISAELRARLIELRRDLHRHPELSFQEHRTSERLYRELAALKPASLERVAKTGLVARFRGADPAAPIVAIRGDIDALPIAENTGLEYASVNAGVMHACGHDVHATWTIGAAALLAERPAAGDVLVILQPAEEIGEGAPAVLASGALEEVRAIFGAHVDRRFAVGEAVAEEGALGASADTFDITLIGVGAHGARPHESRDPIVGLGALIMALQTIVSRRVNPANPAVVTIGKVHGGAARNVIPTEVSLGGTLRALDPATRGLLQDEVRRIAREIAQAYGLEAEIHIQDGSPPVINAREPAAWAKAAVRDVLGEAAAVPMGFVNMGGEDFACYLERIPGCFLRIGARERGGDIIPAHSPYFYAAEESIFAGAAVLAETARVASRALVEKQAAPRPHDQAQRQPE